MLQSHKNGAVSESIVQAKLYQLGHIVSVPMSEEPYDLVVDIDGELLKVQVKTMFDRDVNGTTRYRVELRPRSRGSKARYSKKNVHAFAIYNADYDQVYWLWFDEAPATEASRTIENWQKHTLESKLAEHTE